MENGDKSFLHPRDAHGVIFPPLLGMSGGWRQLPALLTGLLEDSRGGKAPKQAPGMSKGREGRKKSCSDGIRPKHSQASGRQGHRLLCTMKPR